MKKLIALILAMVMVLGLAACGAEKAPETEAPAAPAETAAPAPAETEAPAEAEGPAAANDPKIDLIFTANASSADWHGKAMTVFAEEVEKLSGGSVTCSVFADSTLVSSENEWDAINLGQAAGGADIAWISFQTLSTQPNLAWCEMIGTAYFWTDYDHMISTLTGEVGQEVFDRIAAETEVLPLDVIYLGSRIINTRSKQINSYADMDGLLLRMPGSEAWQNLGRALGAEPTPLAFSELYTALQTGAVEGQDNPLPSCWNAAFYEVAKYFAITNHVVDCILPCINQGTWDSMTPAQQDAVRAAMRVACEYNDTNRLDQEAGIIADLEGAGCTITYPDIAEFKAAATKWYEDHPEVTANWDMELYAKLQGN